MKSILIKDTTREEREKIVAEALGCGSDCSMSWRNNTENE